MIISDGGLNINERNTLDAILLTKNISYIDGIKIDIYLTKDNYFVVANSNNLNDFTLSNKKINEVNYDYLRKVKFPSHIFKYYIPTLDEVLKKYTIRKKLILNLHFVNNINVNDALNNLLKIMSKYLYDYYFIMEGIDYDTNDKYLKSKMLSKKDYIYLDNINDNINNIYIITKYPKKIYNTLLFRQN